MASQIWLNNFETVFIASVKDTPTTGTPATELDYGILRISDGASATLINPTGGNYYVLTALKRSGSTETNVEIMRVTTVDNSVPGECRITVLRAQEGTSAKAYVSGDYISLRITAGGLNELSEDSDVATHVADTANPHAVTKAQVGLSNVDNTSDLSKPVSTATQTALDGKQATLVSGTNIKTVGGVSLLGSGDVAVGTGDVTLTGTQTLTNKTLTAPVMTGTVLNDGYTEEIFAVTGTTPALSPTNGSIQTWTLSGASTPTYGTWAAGQSMILMVTAGANSISWPATTWSKVGGGGAAPSLTATGATCVILWKVGTTTYGALLGSV